MCIKCWFLQYTIISSFSITMSLPILVYSFFINIFIVVFLNNVCTCYTQVLSTHHYINVNANRYYVK